MATFLLQQQELADRLSLDQTVTANATRLKRWLNFIQDDICSRYPFTFLQERAIVQTVVQKTAGTVAATNGSASVPGTSTAFASTDKRSFIQFQNDVNWYEVTNVSSQTLTISPAFGGTTNLTSTYTLRQVYYDLPNTCFQVFDVRQTSTPVKLTNLGVWTLDLFQPDIQTISAPTGYILFREDPDIGATTAKQLQMSFFPIPDAVYNMEVRFTKELSDLSADGDISQIPQPYHLVMVDGAEWLGAKFLNASNEDNLKAKYEYGLQKMIEMENSHGDYFPILGSSDNQTTTRFLPFPTTFQQPE